MPQTIEPVTALPSSSARFSRGAIAKLAIVLLVAGVMIALVLRHVHGVNGPWYWQWPWRRLAAWPLYQFVILAAIPFFIGQWQFHRTGKAGLALVLVVLSCLALQLAILSQQPHSPRHNRLEEIVEDDGNTSYYSAAVILLDQQDRGMTVTDWMTDFPTLMDHYLMGHSRFKPPGLILSCMAWIKLLDPTPAARNMIGLSIGALAASGAAMLYALMRLFTPDRASAFYAASYLALMPSLVLFIPLFDQAYVPVSLGLLCLWVLATRTGKLQYGALFGVAMAAAVFFTYTFLMLGVFLAVYTILFMGDHGRRGVETAVKQGLLAAAAFAGSYLLLYLALGFDPIAVYQCALRLQQLDSVQYARPWPFHMLMDPLDVALGTGWISVPLLAFGLWRLFREPAALGPLRRLAGIGVLQVAMALAVAVFPGENARLLLLILPLLLVPIGAELATWPWRYRTAAFAALLAITTVIGQNMIFCHLPLDGASASTASTGAH